MSNIHADLIKNATDMQSQLLQFSHQLSNLSLKSLDDQNQFKMTTDPSFTNSNVAGTNSPSAANSIIKAGTYISLTNTNTNTTTLHRLTADVTISGSGANGTYNLTDKLENLGDSSDLALSAVTNTAIKINTSQSRLLRSNLMLLPSP